MAELTLYYYEHCPYCVRVLVFIGLAGIKVKHVVLANDDEQTPIGLIGKKMLPILQDQEQTMGESLDIIAVLAEKSGYSLGRDRDMEASVDDFLYNNRLAFRGLTMPRWVDLPMQEFATATAKKYFIDKKTAIIGDFDKALAATAELCADAGAAIDGQAQLFKRLSEQPHSLAAIVMFSGLRGLTAVKAFTLPLAAAEFMQTMSRESGVSLLTDMAV